MNVTLIQTCDLCGKPRTDPDDMLCQGCREQVRLADCTLNEVVAEEKYPQYDLRYEALLEHWLAHEESISTIGAMYGAMGKHGPGDEYQRAVEAHRNAREREAKAESRIRRRDFP